MTWLVPVLFILGSVVYGLWQGRRADLPKQRNKWARHILSADDELRSKGFTFKSHKLRHGILFGRGRAVWVDEQGREATMEAKKL